jgi:hypothetical protein
MLKRYAKLGRGSGNGFHPRTEFEELHMLVCAGDAVERSPGSILTD